MNDNLKRTIGGNKEIINFADDEDLMTEGNVLKLANKEYNPNTFSGLGEVIIRKNIKNINKENKNIITNYNFDKENTIYIIKYDFDLNGNTINIPKNSVLRYKGGSLNNGTLIYADTIIEGIERLNNVVTVGNYTYPYIGNEPNSNEQLAPSLAQIKRLYAEVTNIADDEDLTKIYDSEKGQEVLQLKDRQYIQGSNSGMGYVILRKNKSFAEQIIKANTIYEIRYDFDLGGEEVEIPENCVLKFEGGNLSNGNIVENRIKVIGNHNSNLVFEKGYNVLSPKLRASDIGLIPNNEDYSTFNAKIFDSILKKDITIEIDDTYYLEYNTPYIIDFNLTIIGNGKLVLNGGNSPLFKTSSNPSIIIDGITINSISGALIREDQVDYLINEIVIKNCKLDGFGRIIEIKSSDIDFSKQNFGINKFVVEGCTVTNIKGTSFRLSNTVITKECRIDSNIVDKFIIVFFEWGWDNDYTNGTINKKYITDCIVQNNIASGGITNYDYYHTFLLVEANRVYYKNNNISNVINIKNGGTAYDDYVSSVEYYCENNVFTNICCLPIEGDFVAGVNTPSEILKSKQGVRTKIAKNNIWKIDFLACKKLVGDYLKINDIEFIYTDEQFRKMNFVSIFKIVDGDRVLFDNNVVDIINGGLGLFYGGPSLEELSITSNRFNFDELKFLQGNGAMIRIDNIANKLQFSNNNIIVKSNQTLPLTSYGTLSNTNIKDNCEVVIENNISNTGVDTLCKAKRVLVSNNLFDYSKITNNYTLDRENQNDTSYIKLRCQDEGKYLSFKKVDTSDITMDYIFNPSSCIDLYFNNNKQYYLVKIDSVENSLYTIDEDIIFYHGINTDSIWSKKILTTDTITVTISFKNNGTVICKITNNRNEEANILVRMSGLSNSNHITKTYNSGTFTKKPSSFSGIPVGHAYFCTDKKTTEGASDGIMIYHKGNDVWIDALGRVIS